ncbi:hypothetical protein PPUN110474_34340 [Pseudomonas putida]|nr:hypothetical protein PPUN110474_34340 [Pseudomonas putida]
MAWGLERYLKNLPRKWEVSRAGYMNGQLVGYCLGSVRGGMLWIHRLVVSDEARGRGIGAAILAEMTLVAESAELNGLILKTPMESAGAVNFYSVHGFRQICHNDEYVTMIKNFNRKLTVGVHQPNYLPWLGYFYKMAISNIFIFLDDADFPKGSYVNRNKVAVNGEGKWLTVPTGRGYQTAILDAFPSGAEWVDKHLRSMESSYKRAPYFSKYFNEIAELLAKNSLRNFSDLNIALIEYVASKIGIDCVYLRSSQMNVAGKSDTRLADLVSAVGGGFYVSGGGGANYQSEATFRAKNIVLTYSNFVPEAYPQNSAEFIPGLGVLDALFNIGAEQIGEMFRVMKAHRSG